ncbi:MAG: hypothetical protein ACI9YL_000756 [Luteibaculaceae bacterium]|jgi:hypothetical protein
MRRLLIILVCVLPSLGFAQIENPNFWTANNYTPSYQKLIDWYQQLAREDARFNLLNEGLSDAGKPIYSFQIIPKGWKRSGGMVLFINNAIHPGEPCGVNASAQLAYEIYMGKKEISNTAIVIIPAYNIGGMLNRSSYSRANQLGPKEYGFRGNANNLDLNRDFIKMDSENSKVFAKIFHRWKPEIFVDTHTSNGADYPYTGTLITTQIDKLGKPLGDFVKEQLEPFLYQQVRIDDWPLVPYIYGFNGKDTPLEGGISDYMDSPRYSTGYTALFGTVGFVTEAHMYKPFPARVLFTQTFLEELYRWMEMPRNRAGLQAAQNAYYQSQITKTELPISWTITDATADSLYFTQYKKEQEISKVTGLDHWIYNTQKMETRQIPHRRITTQVNRKVPPYYLVPASNKKVVERLQLAGVIMKKARKVRYEVNVYKFTKVEAIKMPYEGHYYHNVVEIDTARLFVFLSAPYYEVSTNQMAKRFIVETLEPDAPDSFFRWNFFDSCLQQKEYFSAFSFEPKMNDYLEKNPELRVQLNQAKKEDPELRNSHQKQLDFLYSNSPFQEKTAFVYPVYRGVNK